VIILDRPPLAETRSLLDMPHPRHKDQSIRSLMETFPSSFVVRPIPSVPVDFGTLYPNVNEVIYLMYSHFRHPVYALKHDVYALKPFASLTKLRRPVFKSLAVREPLNEDERRRLRESSNEVYEHEMDKDKQRVVESPYDSDVLVISLDKGFFPCFMVDAWMQLLKPCRRATELPGRFFIGGVFWEFEQIEYIERCLLSFSGHHACLCWFFTEVLKGSRWKCLGWGYFHALVYLRIVYNRAYSGLHRYGDPCLKNQQLRLDPEKTDQCALEGFLSLRKRIPYLLESEAALPQGGQ